MPKIHILEQAGGVNLYDGVAHVATPTGNNAVGTPWKTCFLASSGATAPVSRLLVGNSAGKITQAEANQITAGDLLEIGFTFADDPALDTTTRQARITLLADRRVAEFQAEFAERFKYYGYTQAT